MNRESWDEYFMGIATTVSSRCTCLGRPVGAVLVRDKHIIATGYNGPAAGLPHCIEQGQCYPGMMLCTGNFRPSRAIHAEMNAIGQAARHGVATEGATMYTTLEPCLNCLKAIVAAGVVRVVFADPLNVAVRCDAWEELAGCVEWGRT